MQRGSRATSGNDAIDCVLVARTRRLGKPSTRRASSWTTCCARPRLLAGCRLRARRCFGRIGLPRVPVGRLWASAVVGRDGVVGDVVGVSPCVVMRACSHTWRAARRFARAGGRGVRGQPESTIGYIRVGDGGNASGGETSRRVEERLLLLREWDVGRSARPALAAGQGDQRLADRTRQPTARTAAADDGLSEMRRRSKRRVLLVVAGRDEARRWRAC